MRMRIHSVDFSSFATGYSNCFGVPVFTVYCFWLVPAVPPITRPPSGRTGGWRAGAWYVISNCAVYITRHAVRVASRHHTTTHASTPAPALLCALRMPKQRGVSARARRCVLIWSLPVSLASQPLHLAFGPRLLEARWASAEASVPAPISRAPFHTCSVCLAPCCSLSSRPASSLLGGISCHHEMASEAGYMQITSIQTTSRYYLPPLCLLCLQGPGCLQPGTLDPRAP
jgi:hypothetical protein